MSDSVPPHRRQPTTLRHLWDPPGKNTGVGFHFLLQCMKVKSEREFAQSCPTPSDPMDCSLPGSSVHGIFQARVLEWGAISITIPLYPTWSEVPTSLTGIHSSNLQVSGAWYVKSLRLSQCYFCPSAIYFQLDGQVIFTETNQHKVSHWPV